MPSLFYVHGNTLNHKNAMKGCWKIYCRMRCCPGKKRLVFWSWPAEVVYKGIRVRKVIEKNLRLKYVYAEYQGYYMAKLVNRMSLSQRVMMSGHSYGGITASVAMHFIGGGCLRGLTLEGGAAEERPNLRAAVISGAFDHDMLNPGNRYGQTFVAAEKVFVTRNCRDSTLKKWPDKSLRGRQAIGVVGVNANCLGEYRNKLCMKSMTADVGKSHYLKPHLASTRFMAALCCLSFPECLSCALAKANGVENANQVCQDQRKDEEIGDELAAKGFDELTGDGFLDEAESTAVAESFAGQQSILAKVVVTEPSEEEVATEKFSFEDEPTEETSESKPADLQDTVVKTNEADSGPGYFQSSRPVRFQQASRKPVQRRYGRNATQR